MPRTSRPIRVRVHKSKTMTSDAFRRVFSVSAGVFVFVGLILAVLIWVPSMEASLASRAAAGPLKVAFAWPAAGNAKSPTDTWVPPPVRDELTARAVSELERNANPYSAVGLRAVSESLLSTGWFESAPQVRRRGETCEVNATWRTPAAVVRRDGVDYLISQAGHLLPVAYQRGQAPVIAITGAAHEPPASGGQVSPGSLWQGDDIRAALDTIAAISSRSWRDQIEAVDITEYAALRRITLVSRWSGRAVIGGAPRDSIPGEVAFDMKLRRIDELVRQFGQVDAKHRLVEVAGPVILVDDVTTASRNP